MIEEKTRSEISDEYKWDLSLMYKNEDEYNSDFEELKTCIEKLKEYKGIITKDAKTLLEFLKLDTKIDVLIANLYVYASLKNDEDVANKENKKRYSEILNYYSYMCTETSFITPELLKTDYSIIKEYIKENKELEEYKFNLEMIYRYQQYTLTEKEEKLISNISQLQNKCENNFDILLYSIIDYGYIKDEEGRAVKLTNGNYSKYIKSKDRNVRKAASEARLNALKKYITLFGSNYEAFLKADSNIAKAKGYNSSLHMHLFPDGVTEDIYDNLLLVADKNKGVLHKYFKMIKDILGLDKLYTYDLSAPLTKSSNKKYLPSDAKKMILKALSVYGNDYIKVLEKAFDDKWIDFYPNKGKKSGYYENESFKGNPKILANFTDDLNSVSSISHELGHAVHSYFSKENNKPQTSEYPIILAEIASLTNEMLFSNYIVENSNDKDEKLSAIENILDVFAGNFFGTLKEGSIFERKVHSLVDNGSALTDEDFNNIFFEINKDYFGPLVENVCDTKYNWARVSHFYIPFYYYKYSIGVIGACYASKKILSGDKKYLEKYLNFLKLGGTMMPIDALKTIDIDFTDINILEEGIKYFDELIDKFIDIYNS